MATPRTLRAQAAPGSRDGFDATRAREAAADLVIIGGGFGGCAAALAAARRGLRVVMTEETDWVGGQLTAQAVPLDENAWIEGVGVSRSYAALRQGIRDYYRRHYPLTHAAAANPRLNPGNGTVSGLCHEPRVGLAVLEAMLAPFVASGRVTVLLRHRPLRAAVAGDGRLGRLTRATKSQDSQLSRTSGGRAACPHLDYVSDCA